MVDAMAMADAVDLLEHWIRHPTSQQILEAVHINGAGGHGGAGPQLVSGTSRVRPPATKDEAIAEVSAAGAMAGLGPMTKIPPELRKRIEAAEELKKKHKLPGSRSS